MGSRIDIKIRPYYEWEEYKNGMYSTEPLNENRVVKSVALLSDPDLFRSVLIKIIKKWPVTMYYHMNSSHNKKAFLGQTACNFNHKATDREVREAWSRMNPDQQYKANLIAHKIIKTYEIQGKKIHNQLEIQGL